MIVAFWDLECSNLQADYGQLLCGCILEYDPNRKFGFGKMRTFELTDYDQRRFDDKKLAIRIRDQLHKYDVIVGYNSYQFDLPFLNTRLEQWSVKGCTPRRHIDLMYTVRYKLRLHSASLVSAQHALKLTESKTVIKPSAWVRAMGGDKRSYRYIVDHCKRDVKVLCELYGKTKHLIREIK